MLDFQSRKAPSRLKVEHPGRGSFMGNFIPKSGAGRLVSDTLRDSLLTGDLYHKTCCQLVESVKQAGSMFYLFQSDGNVAADMRG